MRDEYSDVELIGQEQDKVSCKDMTESQLALLRHINHILTELEPVIVSEFSRLNSLAKARVEDQEDWVDDYEIRCHITFYLNENDPSNSEEKDNILVVLSENGKRPHPRLGDGEDHNQPPGAFPISDERHCWLFHCLYDHTDLGWGDILRIGDVIFDVTIEY